MKRILLSLAVLLVSSTSHAYLSLNPGSMEFGSVRVGTQASQLFTIVNMGNQEAVIQSCMVFGAFQCQLVCYPVLQAGQSCSGIIYFRPQFQRYELQTVLIGTSQGSLSMSVHGTGKL